ncbi:sensor domain-containing protein [Metabacillus elymi]|uniref:EAL domain-containing protein n=1 Tax=Metabacillus elymi TaxID=2745198 RepID=A0ABX6S2Q2_9BACI|nr:EAL domain-containing protein [Metabacillus sp. KUDC1714]QNF28375.1 EAL domain-containing protein [Metabacillus sp. KUDC1714]
MRDITTSKRVGIRISLIYLFISIVWVLASDLLINSYITMTWVNILKGWIFVFINALLLYKLIQRNFEIVAEKKELYQQLIENSLETNLIHIDGEIVYINQAGVNLLKAYNRKQIIGKSVFDFIPTHEKEKATARIEETKTLGKSRPIIITYKCLNGEEVICESLGFATTYQGKTANHILVRDVTEREKAIGKINYLAFYDELTGLPNRNKLYAYMEKIIGNQMEEGYPFIVMFIDMDRFKIVNDAMGHSSGDKMLKEVANRLSASVDQDALVARFGGDEFVIVIPYMKKEQSHLFAQQIIEMFKQPIHIDQNEVYTTPSIGITCYPDDGDDVDTLIENADTAMYYAKKTGKNKYKVFTQLLRDDLNNHFTLENGLRKALEKNEFILYYQPQLHLETGSVIGVESLIRWNHPKKGLLSPVLFIPVAEENGLIVQIGYWVLDTACRQLTLWHEKGLSNITMGVNISPIQFRHKDFINHLEKILTNNKLDPKYLNLEITESVFMNIDESLFLLKKLKEIGVKISIDDFGTGYSSLSVLKDLPIDYLKIDKSFVDDLYSNEKNIVQPIIDMGNNLNLQLVAEGIECKEQLMILKEKKCHIGQGYYFCKPMDVNVTEAFIKNNLK